MDYKEYNDNELLYYVNEANEEATEIIYKKYEPLINNLARKIINYCKNSGECVHKDDMAEILQKMIDADVLVLASPVYFYSINAQLKAVIDRTVARWLEVKNKEFYYIATMADESLSSAKTTIDCFRGYADCVEGAVERGIIIGNGVYELGTIKDTPVMNKAYEMGRNV